MSENGIRSGVFAASLTPMTERLQVNNDLLLDHARWLLTRGCDGLVILGSTGEANSFSVAERMELLDKLTEGGVPAGRLIVGTGCCAVPDTVQLTRHAIDTGAQGVLMLPPFYYKGVSDDGLFEAFRRTIESVDREGLRICLYHFPKMSGIPYSFSLIEKLVGAFPKHIVAIKDSSGDLQHMIKLIKTFPGLKVFSGSERFLLENLKAGGAGCITATANVVSDLAAEVFRAFQKDGAVAVLERVTALRSVIERYPLVSALKQVMAEWRKNSGWLRFRPPLEALSPNDRVRLIEDLRKLDFTL